VIGAILATCGPGPARRDSYALSGHFHHIPRTPEVELADINVERKGPSIWPWIVGLIVLALLIWALVEMFGRDDTVTPVGPLTDTVGAFPADTVRQQPMPLDTVGQEPFGADTLRMQPGVTDTFPR
jgi:hypothetical protein